MRTRDLIVALDQGSSSSRAILFDLKGRIITQVSRPVKIRRRRAGWVEHDPKELASSLESALDGVLAKTVSRDRILGAGMAVQRSTIVFCDKKDFRAISSAPSWMDGRATEIVAPLQERQNEIHRLTGLYATPYYSAPKIRWFLDNDAKVRALADTGRLLCLPVSSYLAARLTHGAVLAVDPTCAQRTLLMNLETMSWDAELLKLFDLNAELLPTIMPSAGDWGQIKRKGHQFPLLATVGDQQSAAVGLGARQEGATVINYGTGAFILRHTGTAVGHVAGLLSSCAPTSRDRRGYFLEGTVHAAATSFDWLRDNFGAMGKVSTLDATIKRSRQHVLMLPAIGGLGAPRWDYRTKSAFFGMDAQTTKDDLVRATAEGLSMLVAGVAAAMAAGGFAIAGARVSGGLSRADALMALQADCLGLTLQRCRDIEATALGAAVLAAETAGIPNTEAMTAARLEKSFSPKLDETNRRRRRSEWTAFVDATQRLSREI